MQVRRLTACTLLLLKIKHLPGLIDLPCLALAGERYRFVRVLFGRLEREMTGNPALRVQSAGSAWTMQKVEEQKAHRHCNTSVVKEFVADLSSNIEGVQLGSFSWLRHHQDVRVGRLQQTERDWNQGGTSLQDVPLVPARVLERGCAPCRSGIEEVVRQLPFADCWRIPLCGWKILMLL